LTVLAQTYIHLAVDPSERQILDTQTYIQYLGALSASEHFRQEVDLEFRVEQGSLKGWLTVFGGLYVALGNYGSLREGIDYAVKDSRDFSAWIIEKFKAEVPMPPKALYRTERRLGVAGRIQRLYPLLEETSDLMSGRNKREAIKNLQQVQDQLRSITADLAASGEDEIAQKIEEMIPAPIRDRLPPPSAPYPGEGHVPQITLRDDEKYARSAKPKEFLLSMNAPPKPPRFR
jgi:hypothetical protein